MYLKGYFEICIEFRRSNIEVVEISDFLGSIVLHLYCYESQSLLDVGYLQMTVKQLHARLVTRIVSM